MTLPAPAVGLSWLLLASFVLSQGGHAESSLRRVKKPSAHLDLGPGDENAEDHGEDGQNFPTGTHLSALDVKTTALRSFSASDSRLTVGKANESDEWLWPSSSRSLLVCNAYALQAGLNVFARVPQRNGGDAEEAEKLTSETLTYKTCESLRIPPLGPGSILDFRANGDTYGPLVGSFVLAGGLPTTGSVLLVVVFRNDRYTSVADFASHIFDNSDDPQVAVIDAFRGEDARPVGLPGASAQANTGLEVRPGFQWQHAALADGRNGKADAAAADVAWHLARYGSELSLPAHPLPDGRGAVPTGSWEFRMPGEDPHGYVLELWPDTGQKYVALRVGVDAVKGPHYPMELIILPHGSSVWRSDRNVAASLQLYSSKCLGLLLLALSSWMGSSQ